MSNKTSKTFTRLPNDPKPSEYHLEIQINFQSFTFTGEESVKLLVSSSTITQITINALDITVGSAKYNDINGEISYNTDEEKVTFNFPEQLPVGEGVLHLEFKGKLNELMKGFYRSKYTDEEGNDKYMAITHFEPTQARRAFPCWDEPMFKAVFNISLTVPKNMTALSNMPEMGRSDKGNDLVRFEFSESPLMSTYLVAFAVGELDLLEGRDADGVLVRIASRPGKSHLGQFALDVACRALPFYREYFQLPYGLEKLDLIAIPDFAGGAMENWGLVTYREAALLIDEKESSLGAKQYVALIVGHELAHMWFGNTVTMEWWTDLWLKEGFASWIEYLCVDFCYPEFDIWTQFVESTLDCALNADSLKTSHPIEVEVNSPNEIDEIFDAISYDKGASIIRMLHDYLGMEKFREGLRIYLNRHKWGNACTEDLWTALEESSKAPVGRIMTTWTKQMGYPVLSLTPVLEDGKMTGLKVAQRRFLADGSKEVAWSEARSMWCVPITLCRSDRPSEVLHKFVLETDQATVALPEPLDPATIAIMANPGAVGLYRVLYSQEQIPRLVEAMPGLPPRDRYALLSDMFALAQAGEVSTLEAVRVLSRCSGEANFTVWSAIAECLGVVRMLTQEGGYPMEPLNKFITQLALPRFQQLEFEEKSKEDHNSRLLRPLLISLLGRAGHPEVVTEARRRFESHAKAGGDSRLTANIRAPVYATILTNGGVKELGDIHRLYDATDLQEERIRLLRALGHAPSHLLLEHVLEFAMSNRVRNQDRLFAILGCIRSPGGQGVAWNFFRDNWPRLKEIYAGQFLLSRLIQGLLEGFATEDRAKEVEKFFTDNPAPCKRAVEQAIESIHNHAALLSRDGEAVAKFLADEFGPC